MNLIEWNDSFSVNIVEIDNQHKNLINMINELYNAMSKGRSKEIMEEIISKMINYADYHFTTEEDLMLKYGYGEYISHKNEHNSFIEKVKKFNEDYKSGALFLSVEVLTFLSTWLKNHILGTDKKYSKFLNDKGVT